MNLSREESSGQAKHQKQIIEKEQLLEMRVVCGSPFLVILVLFPLFHCFASSDPLWWLVVSSEPGKQKKVRLHSLAKLKGKKKFLSRVIYLVKLYPFISGC